MGIIRWMAGPAQAAVMFLTMALASATSGAEVDYGTLIDMAGRQRMLTQRIVKAYCLVGMQVTPEVSRAQLESAVRRFDSQLADLSKRTSGAGARKALARVTTLWKPFRKVATGPVNREGARWLAGHDDDLLQAAHELVLVLQEAAGTPQARLVNIAGRQRMLSQRLAKFYMLRAYGVDSPAIGDGIDTGGNEFAGALETLRVAPENTPPIDRELAAVRLQWEWFKAALELQGAQSYVLVVADASESILNSMELVTEMYAQLGRR